MRVRHVLCAIAASTAVAGSALAADAGPTPFGQAVGSDVMGTARGGTEIMTQGNLANQTATNVGSMTVANGAAQWNGAISPAAILGNHGIATVMQNTGNMANLSNAMNVNVYLH
ncbi:MAG: hypothetical protein M0006_11330 [Magnetospirillum sp.]|nr:hypothetical protein [Magnetospirillum sp.]